MGDAAILELIRGLSLRISELEGGSYKFWVPVIISILALGLSALSIVKAKSMSEKNMRQVALQGIKSGVDSAKAQIEALSIQIAPLKAKQSPLNKSQLEEFQIKQQALDSAFERLLNAYNDGCQKFFKRQVDTQDFIDLYHQDIADYIREFESKFLPPLTRFDAMLRYYNEKHKNPKHN
ncbi:hypothetical protein M8R20_45135 [Pseudomonas sp. R2.Fl]|nr:hypothetical protein [Pseudomonas sp. R2.Fl]